jgi:hypothetical protein
LLPFGSERSIHCFGASFAPADKIEWGTLMKEDIDWTNCPICNRPFNPNDHNASVEFEGEKIHATCVDVAERLQRRVSRLDGPK